MDEMIKKLIFESTKPNTMRNILPLLLSGCMSVFFISCSNDDSRTTETALFAIPLIKPLAEIRNSVSVTAARQAASDGKIYVTEDKLFYIAEEEGVHIYDNSNPANPINTAFLNIQGVHDIAIKGNYLYADNYIDLLVFDISDLTDIELVKTVENVLNFSPAYPDDAEFFAYDDLYSRPGELLIGYSTEIRERPTGELIDMYYDGLEASNNGAPSAGSIIGTGGSYAKFQINNNALYTTESFKLNVFDITQPLQTSFNKSVYMDSWFGGEFETLFRQGNYLFVGATSGMYVINAFDEFNPFFISGFSHATACDPVVVSGNTAYITVRGGTSCGAIEDQVNVIDITDISSPTLLSTTFLNQPRGLGVKDHIVYVCAENGLQVYDASDASGLVLKNSYSDSVTDVIPLESQFITVGPIAIKQYAYGKNFTLTLLSTISLQ